MALTIEDKINNLQNTVNNLQNMVQRTHADLKKFIQIKEKLGKMEFLFSNFAISLHENFNMEKPLFRKSIEHIAKTLSSEPNIRVRVVGYTNDEKKQDHSALCAEFIKMCILSAGVQQNPQVASSRLEAASEYPLWPQSNVLSRVVLEVESDNKPFIDPIDNINLTTKIVFKFLPYKSTIDNSDENLKKRKTILYYLIKNPDKNLDITGYGNDAWWFRLSDATMYATSVRDYILSFSISPRDHSVRLVKKDNVFGRSQNPDENRCAEVSLPSLPQVELMNGPNDIPLNSQ